MKYESAGRPISLNDNYENVLSWERKVLRKSAIESNLNRYVRIYNNTSVDVADWNVSISIEPKVILRFTKRLNSQNHFWPFYNDFSIFDKKSFFLW